MDVWGKKKKRKTDVDWQRGMNGEEVDSCEAGDVVAVHACSHLPSSRASSSCVTGAVPSAAVAMGILEKGGASIPVNLL